MISTVLGGLFLLVLTAVAVLELLNSQLFLGLASLLIVAPGICYIVARRLKRFERPLAFLSSLLLLARVLLIALYVRNMAFKLPILLLAVAWGFFVAPGAYGLLFKRQNAQLRTGIKPDTIHTWSHRSPEVKECMETRVLEGINDENLVQASDARVCLRARAAARKHKTVLGDLSPWRSWRA